MTHARHGLDLLIHSPVRFSVLSLLLHVDEAEFSAIRDLAEISDSQLSQALSALTRAGYTTVRKRRFGISLRTWAAATQAGADAHAENLQILAAIARGEPSLHRVHDQLSDADPGEEERRGAHEHVR